MIGVKARSEGLTRGANEIAQGGDVGTVCADAAGVYGQTEALREIEIDACVIQFRKTESRGRLHSIHASRIDRPRRTVAVPRPASQLVELFPIAFVPSVHRSFSSPFLDAVRALQGSLRFCFLHQLPNCRTRTTVRTVPLIVRRQRERRKFFA
jgi:hypothetical protein